MKKIFFLLLLIPIFSLGTIDEELFNAVKSGKTDQVKILLEKGANFEAVDKNGKNPLFYAVKNQKREIAKILSAIALYKNNKLGSDYFGYSSVILEFLMEENEWLNNFLSSSKHRYKRSSSRRERMEEIDIYSLVSGGLAIRESLQLETIRPSIKEGKKVFISTLTAPQIKSHPFAQMLKNRTYNVPELSKVIPEDFYYIHAGSLKKMLESFDFIIEKSMAVYKRYNAESVDFHVKEKLMTQLALKENKEARIFYDTVVKEIIITGSDPFVRSGSDVSLVFHLNNKTIFKTMIQRYRNAFQNEEGAQKNEKNIEGFKADYLFTRDAKINSFFVELNDETVIISNSQGALTKLLKTYLKKEKSLSDALDFKYMQSVYRQNTNKEITLYLSDAFIRHLVSPELRIKESRRMLEAMTLSTIEKLSIFYKQITGKYPTQLEPILSLFSKIDEKTKQMFLSNWQGISLLSGSANAYSPIYGKIGFFKPNIDLDLKEVSETEAKDYENFVSHYKDFWRDYFDPIGVRIHFENNKLTAETHILPLIDLSIYQIFEQVLGGKPFLFNYQEIKGDIFSLTIKLKPEIKSQMTQFRREIPELYELSNILGDFATISVSDCAPMIDFDSRVLFTEFLFSSRSHISAEHIIFPLLAWSVFHPIKLSLPLKKEINSAELEKKLDKMLKNLPGKYGRYFYDEMEWDYYQTVYHGQKIRVIKWNLFHTLSFRFFCLIDQSTIHITSTEDYMKRLIDSIASNQVQLVSKKANILMRFNPASILLEKDLFTSNLIENLKKAHFRNIATYQVLKMLYPDSENLNLDAMKAFGLEPVCPVGGQYTYDPETRQFVSSFFGSILAPVIQVEEIRKKLDQSLFSLTHASVMLEFTDTGIVTRLEVE